MTERKKRSAQQFLSDTRMPWQREDVSSGIASAVEAELAAVGKRAKIRSVRFVPSTMVTQANGDIELIVNTTVEVSAREVMGMSSMRPEVLESVVTLTPADHDIVKSVRTHALQRGELV